MDDTRPRALGTLLLERNLVSIDELESALAEQARTRRQLGQILRDRGALDETDLAVALAAQHGLDFVDLDDAGVDPLAAAAVPARLAARHQAIPIQWEDGRLLVAMADPANLMAVDDIRTVTGYQPRVVVATPAAIERALQRTSAFGSNMEDISAQAAREAEPAEDLARMRDLVDDAPIVKLVDALITQAVQERASDVHVEPTEQDVRIRYRIDGVLHEKMRSPKSIQLGLTSRLKIMADVDISERRVPQDGRISLQVKGRPIDLRVATLPVAHGEKVVLRILDKSAAVLRLTDLGFLPENMARFESAFRRPHGMILVTGPTGSGKSTTLYATINILNDPSRNVITVEDPIEYRLAGINQMQVNPRAGLTFATALRSILRADPDVLLVGEIRDRETAVIAIEAALTGHLVLSTLHTNDAASTPARLVEMGVEHFLVASAVDCIVAQRLVRRLCERCKAPYTASGSELEGLVLEADVESHDVYRPTGCSHCGNTGYRGRLALHEVMLVTEEIERLIVSGGHSEDVRKVATEQGMLSLRQAGITHVLRGVTSVEEVLRVVA